MSLLSRLFGGGGEKSGATQLAEEYDGFKITPDPVKEPGGFRVNALIEKEIDGVLKSHQLVRADTCSSEDEAVHLSILKAKQVIDQQGDSILN